MFKHLLRVSLVVALTSTPALADRFALVLDAGDGGSSITAAAAPKVRMLSPRAAHRPVTLSAKVATPAQASLLGLRFVRKFSVRG